MLGSLTPQLKLEMQYVLQHRRDERLGKLAPTNVARVVRPLAQAGVGSLLDHDEDTWREHSTSLRTDTRSRGLLIYAHRTIMDLAEAGGWEAEYSTRRLENAPPRVRRPKHSAVQPHPTTLAAGTSQTLDPTAPGTRPWPGSGRRTPAASHRPIRPVPCRSRYRPDRSD